MTYWVLRQIRPQGLTALAHHATTLRLAEGAVKGTVVHGDFLEWSDPDAKNGMGDDRWTADLAKAKRFATFSDAMQCWKAQSRVRPWRDDGKANRPMTAYSVTPEKHE